MGKRMRKDITCLQDDHAADGAGVCRFSQAMALKLAAKRAQGYSGWNNPTACSTEMLWEMLVDHVKKGDPVDIANFAMMVWNRRNPKGI